MKPPQVLRGDDFRRLLVGQAKSLSALAAGLGAERIRSQPTRHSTERAAA